MYNSSVYRALFLLKVSWGHGLLTMDDEFHDGCWVMTYIRSGCWMMNYIHNQSLFD